MRHPGRRFRAPAAAGCFQARYSLGPTGCPLRGHLTAPLSTKAGRLPPYLRSPASHSAANLRPQPPKGASSQRFAPGELQRNAPPEKKPLHSYGPVVAGPWYATLSTMVQRRPVRTPAVVFLPGVLLHCSSPAPLGSCSRWKRKRRGKAATVNLCLWRGGCFSLHLLAPSACVQPGSHRYASQPDRRHSSHPAKARCRPPPITAATTQTPGTR